MADVVVTISEEAWPGWLAEGDLAGDLWSGKEHSISVLTVPDIEPGERVYIVAGAIVRGYAPLLRVEPFRRVDGRYGAYLIRGGDAVNLSPFCTMKERCSCVGLAGWSGPHARRIHTPRSYVYRAWEREEEWLLGDWKTARGTSWKQEK